MKLEQQVTSLELSKRLKELGVKQESLFNWVNTKKPRLEDSRIVGCGRCGSVLNGIPLPQSVERYSAYTVAELLEMLPVGVFIQKSGNHYDVLALEDSKLDNILDLGFGYGDCQAENPADALALMVEYLAGKSTVQAQEWFTKNLKK